MGEMYQEMLKNLSGVDVNRDGFGVPTETCAKASPLGPIAAETTGEDALPGTAGEEKEKEEEKEEAQEIELDVAATKTGDQRCSLLEKHVRDLENQFRKSEEEGVEFDEASFVSLFEGYAKLGDDRRTTNWFRIMCEKNVRPDSHSYDILLAAEINRLRRSPDPLRSTKLNRRAMRILGSMMKRDIKPSKSFFDHIIAALAHHHQAFELAKIWLYKMKSKSPDVHPDVKTYNILIAARVKRGHIREADQFLRMMKKEGLQPNEESFAALILKPSYLKDDPRTIRLFNQMKKNHLQPDVRIYNRVIAAHLNRIKSSKHPERIDSVVGIFEQMLQENIIPDKDSFATLINAYAYVGEFDRANQWLDAMKRANLTPDCSTYTVLIKSCTMRAKKKMGAKAISQAEEYFEDMLIQGIKPDADAYSTMMHMSSHFGDVDGAHRWFKKMVEAKVVPHTAAYRILIAAHTNRGKENGDEKEIEEAEQILNRMLERNIKPDIVCFSALINVSAQLGMAERAYMWFNKMKRMSFKPELQTYNSILNAYAKHGKTKRDSETLSIAEQILKDMLEDGVQPNIVSFTTLIDVAAETGNVNRANYWFGQLKEAKLKPGVHAYSVFIKAHTLKVKETLSLEEKKEACQEAGRILKEMEEEGIQPNLITYTSLIDAAASMGDVNSANHWFDKMKSDGVQPSSVTYNVLMNAHAQRAKQTQDPHEVRQAEGLFKEMRKKGVQPCVVTYTTLIEAAAQLGDVHRARKWFELMQTKGLRPNLRAFSSTLSSCAVIGDLEFAAELYQQMKATGLEPNSYVLLNMMRTCANAEEGRVSVLDTAEGLMDDMKTLHIKPLPSIFSLLLSLHRHHSEDARPKEWIRWIFKIIRPNLDEIQADDYKAAMELIKTEHKMLQQ